MKASDIVPQGIKVTFEFASVEQAIAWLGTKIMGGPGNSTPAKTVAPTDPVAPVPSSQRKGRADKGKPRGPHKNAAPPVIPEPSPVQPRVDEAGTKPPAGAAPNAAATAPVPAEGDKPQPSGTLPGAAAPTVGDKDAEVQAAVQNLFDAKGINAVRSLLNSFGVNRARDLSVAWKAKFLAAAQTA